MYTKEVTINEKNTRARSVYLHDCKDRALAELEHGSIVNAVTSMFIDIRKWNNYGKDMYTPDALELLIKQGLYECANGTVVSCNKWINGFK